MMDINGSAGREKEKTCIFLVDRDTELLELDLNGEELAYLKEAVEKEQRIIFINRYEYWLGFVYQEKEKKGAALRKSWRLDGAEIQQWAVKNKLTELQLADLGKNEGRLHAFAEGLVLKNYQFLKYFSNPAKKKNSLEGITLIGCDTGLIDVLKGITKSVYISRDLINEPLS